MTWEVTACDALDAWSSDTVVVTVEDVLPTLEVDVSGDPTVGEQIMLQIAADDPVTRSPSKSTAVTASTDTLTDLQALARNLVSATSITANTLSGSVAHVYTQPDDDEIIVRAVTKDGTTEDVRVLAVTADGSRGHRWGGGRPGASAVRCGQRTERGRCGIAGGDGCADHARAAARGQPARCGDGAPAPQPSIRCRATPGGPAQRVDAGRERLHRWTGC